MKRSKFTEAQIAFVLKQAEDGTSVAEVCRDPPRLEWSSAMFRKTEETHGKQATQARRDCHEVTAG